MASNTVYATSTPLTPSGYTVVNPPTVTEIRVQDIRPLQLPSGEVLHVFTVRSNASDRNKLANTMLYTTNPSNNAPTVYLFPDRQGQLNTYGVLSRTYPQSNIQLYDLSQPVRLTTYQLPNAGVVASPTVLVNSVPVPIALNPSEAPQVQVLQQQPQMLGGQLYSIDNIPPEIVVSRQIPQFEEAIRSRARQTSSKNKSSARGSRGSTFRRSRASA